MSYSLSTLPQKTLLPFLLALVILCGAGCTRIHTDQGYTTLVPRDPSFEQSGVNMSKLEEKGEKSTRRGEGLTDISQFSPGEGESYRLYRQRMAYTLRAQEEEIQELEEQIRSMRKSISQLDEQVSAATQQQTEMRLALSGDQDEEVVAYQRWAIPFHRYLVEKGDTLQKIAFEHYGTHSAWLALYRLNHKNLPDGPNRIEIGTSLFLPNVQ